MQYLCKSFFNNARKPKGILGKWILKSMNQLGHKELANWAFPYIKIKNGDTILDIGCGGGANVARFLEKYPNSIVNGIDYSPVSVSLTKKINKAEIEKGRCCILEGNVRHLPYEHNTFDWITAFETVYYWPDLVDSFRQVRRVLKHNGKFAVINGADADGGWVWDRYIDGMHTYTSIELEQYLFAAGFSRIEINRKKEYHFICAIAYK